MLQMRVDEGAMYDTELSCELFDADRDDVFGFPVYQRSAQLSAPLPQLSGKRAPFWVLRMSGKRVAPVAGIFGSIEQYGVADEQPLGHQLIDERVTTELPPHVGSAGQ